MPLQCHDKEIAMDTTLYEAEAKRMRHDTVGCTLLAILLVGIFGGALLA
jgi:hypothetical protein